MHSPLCRPHCQTANVPLLHCCCTAAVLPACRLDCPVEVVNMQELRAMEQSRVPFYASNLSVGLSISVAGFGMQVATGGLPGADRRVGNKAGAGWTRLCWCAHGGRQRRRRSLDRAACAADQRCIHNALPRQPAAVGTPIYAACRPAGRAALWRNQHGRGAQVRPFLLQYCCLNASACPPM